MQTSLAFDTPTTTTRPAFLTIADGRLALKCAYDDRDLAKGVRGCRWDGATKRWLYPAMSAIVDALRVRFPSLTVDDRVTLEFAPVIDEMPDWSTAEPVEPPPLRDITLYRHQIAAYNLGLSMPQHAFFLEQRTGKTPAEMAVLGRRFQRGEIKRALIIAPKSVIPEWSRQLEAFADFPYWFLDLAGQAPLTERARRLLTADVGPDRLFIVGVNYDSVARLLPALEQWRPDAIVADESQRLKSPTSQVSKAVYQLALDCKYRAALTGTPVTQGAEDLFAQYRYLDPRIFGTSWIAFRAAYCIMGGFEQRKIVGYNNLAELTAKAHKIAFRCRLADVYDMPDIVDSYRFCDLEPPARRLYDQLVADSVAELADARVVTAPNVMTRILRLQQMTGGYGAVDNDDPDTTQRFTSVHISNAKLSLLAEVVADTLGEDPANKVVVFARFRAELEAIEQALEKWGVEVLHGGTKDRGAVVARFQSTAAGSPRVFVGQTQAASSGIPLDAADTVIHYSYPFSYEQHYQCRFRVQKVGKVRPTSHIYLQVNNSVDAQVLRALKAKRNLADLAVDNWRSLITGQPDAATSHHGGGEKVA